MSQIRETKPASPWQSTVSTGDLQVGEVVGAYVIEGPLGEGGCGIVYAARHTTTDQRVAVKVLRAMLASSPRMVERFVREVDLVNLLRHPNIVEIHDLGTLDDGRPYYTMEFLEGTTLDALLRAGGRMPPAEALEILEPVCNALRAAHAAGIVHRDVKASNIFLSRDGGAAGIKLLDFGIAKLTDPGMSNSGLTTFGHPVGTPTAMAPEQILGETLDERVDVYALGVLLHRMLVGRPPFRADEALELARQHLEDPAPRPSRGAPVSPEVDDVVLRCLEKRPERRFDSVKSFLAALRLAAGAPPRESMTGIPGEALTRAAGIYVEVRVANQKEDLDDTMADDFGRVLDLAEELLVEQGFNVLMTSGNAILAAHSVDGGLDHQQAVEIAASLHGSLSRRPEADLRVRLVICVHVDDALVKIANPREIIGGAIVRMSSWAPSATTWGLFATPAALGGVSGFVIESEPGQMAKRIRPAT